MSLYTIPRKIKRIDIFSPNSKSNRIGGFLLELKFKMERGMITHV